MPVPSAAPPAPTPIPPGLARGTPSARRRARELGIDLTSVHGTGPHGAVTRADVETASVGPSAARPAVRLRITPFARRRAQDLGVDVAVLRGTAPDGTITARDVESAPRVPATPPSDRAAAMRRAIGAAMARAKREIPHYYASTTVDLGPALAWLAEQNARRSVTERLLAGVLFLKATALALHEVPELNAHWTGASAPPLEDVHLGVAISLRGGGLVAPALRNADLHDLGSLMKAFADLVERTRAGRLRSSELTDPTITVTSLGERGVEQVFPIIHPPQVAMVGFGRIVERPWAVDDRVVVRPVVTVTLAADHRVSDGHRGGLFLAAIDRLLQRPETL